MPRYLPSMTRSALALATCAAVAGCGSFDGATQRMAGAITPYKVEVVQGNFISSEQVAALKPGMSRLQVRELLGSPLVTSAFHADRWDYVFTIKREGVSAQPRKLTTFFKGEVLERFEGDPMPSEAEFVASLDGKRRSAKVPVLEASEETLARQARPAAPGAAGSAAAPGDAGAPAGKTYPPLEPAR